MPLRCHYTMFKLMYRKKLRSRVVLLNFLSSHHRGPRGVGAHSTEVAFALRSPQPGVQFSASAFSRNDFNLLMSPQDLLTAHCLYSGQCNKLNRCSNPSSTGKWQDCTESPLLSNFVVFVQVLWLH